MPESFSGTVEYDEPKYDYDAVSLFMPSLHGYQTLILVKGEPHPEGAITPETRAKLGNVTGLHSRGGTVHVVFEDGELYFKDIAHTVIKIGKKK